MKKLSIVTLLFLSFSFSEAFAQFEGTIKFKTYEMENSEKVETDDAFTLHITPDRMLLQGDESYEVGGAFKAEGILVRHKEQDFVFLTGEDQAMQITKEGITSLMNMFGDNLNKAEQEVEKEGSKMKFKETGESSSINGYQAEKFIITNSEKPEKRSEVWMTKDLDINWGMLAEPWGDNMKRFMGESDLPLDFVLEEGYFPIKMQQYENDALTEELVAEVSETDVARKMVEIPSNVKVVNLQQYIFEQMRKSQ